MIKTAVDASNTVDRTDLTLYEVGVQLPDGRYRPLFSFCAPSLEFAKALLVNRIKDRLDNAGITICLKHIGRDLIVWSGNGDRPYVGVTDPAGLLVAYISGLQRLGNDAMQYVAAYPVAAKDRHEFELTWGLLKQDKRAASLYLSLLVEHNIEGVIDCKVDFSWLLDGL